MEIKEEVHKLIDELIELRRDFHMHPELGYREFNTSDTVFKYLESLGVEVKKVAKTGVVGLLRGRYPGKTLLLRADMDALPITEKTDLPFASVNDGIMHACGHDGHIAMLLIAAKILANHRESIRGNIKFVFQPNEEEAGALDMINEGVLDDPKVDAAFACHLWSPLKSGEIGLSEGPVMGALEEFELTIIGRGGHTGSPHEAIDPILAATNIIQSLQSLQTREINPLYPITIMVGKINGGTGRNIIANQVDIGGTIRFLFNDEVREKEILLRNFERIIKGISEAMGVEYSLKFIPSNPSLYNHDSLIRYVRKAAVETFGVEDNFIKYRSMAGEDFAEFSQRVPSLFYFIGTGNKEKETTFPHHHPMFKIDEDTLKYGVEMHVRSAFGFLND